MRLSLCPPDIGEQELECFVFGEAFGDKGVVEGFFSRAMARFASSCSRL